jgi:hypothetical protein
VRSLILTLPVLLALPAPALAQTAVAVCTEQSELEQLLESDAAIRPDGCREARINILEHGRDRLCRIDFAPEAEGVIAELRDVAAPRQWWIRCADLGAALQ